MSARHEHGWTPSGTFDSGSQPMRQRWDCECGASEWSIDPPPVLQEETGTRELDVVALARDVVAGMPYLDPLIRDQVVRDAARVLSERFAAASLPSGTEHDDLREWAAMHEALRPYWMSQESMTAPEAIRRLVARVSELEAAYLPSGDGELERLALDVICAAIPPGAQRVEHRSWLSSVPAGRERLARAVRVLVAASLPSGDRFVPVPRAGIGAAVEALEACEQALLTGIDWCRGPSDGEFAARVKMHTARGKALEALAPAPPSGETGGREANERFRDGLAEALRDEFPNDLTSHVAYEVADRIIASLSIAVTEFMAARGAEAQPALAERAPRRHSVYPCPVGGGWDGYRAACHDCSWSGTRVWKDASAALLEAQSHVAPQQGRVREVPSEEGSS
jgi:hypothetical protein